MLTVPVNRRFFLTDFIASNRSGAGGGDIVAYRNGQEALICSALRHARAVQRERRRRLEGLHVALPGHGGLTLGHPNLVVRHGADPHRPRVIAGPSAVAASRILGASPESPYPGGSGSRRGTGTGGRGGSSSTTS